MRKFTPLPLVFVIAAMLLLSNFLPSMAGSETPPILSYGTIEYPPFPLLQGWGGVRLQEVERFQDDTGSRRTEPPSEVFPGEVASDVEMTMRLLKERGYNAIRAYFEDPRDDLNPRNLTIPWERNWVWNAEWFEKFVEIARHYDMWMICDYHEYAQAFEFEDEWIQLWRDEIIAPHKNLYDKLIWEPINEPLITDYTLTEEQKITELGRLYQRWIDMCRGLDDTHYIIASGKCFWSSLPKEDWYPDLHDPLNKTYLNYHMYYFKKYHENQWTVAGAQAYADYWTDVIISVREKYGKQFVNTETGIPYETYDEVNLAYITRLIENFNREGIGLILWHAGDWKGLYGHMKTWGNEIS